MGRVQASVGDVIVGASYIHTQPFKEQFWAHGDTEFAGVDARWMRGGVQLGGEWINGHPFEGTKTFGGYADVMVHRPFMGPVTAVARAERLRELQVAPKRQTFRPSSAPDELGARAAQETSGALSLPAGSDTTSETHSAGW